MASVKNLQEENMLIYSENYPHFFLLDDFRDQNKTYV